MGEGENGKGGRGCRMERVWNGGEREGREEREVGGW